MAALKKYSQEELQKARNSGFRKKKPKKGIGEYNRMPRTEAEVDRYITKMNNWIDSMRNHNKAKAAKRSEKARVKKKLEALKRRI